MSSTSENELSQQGGSEPVGSGANYRVAVTAVPGDRDTVLSVLEGVLGLNAIDARTRLRHVPIIWPEETSEQTAEDAAGRLTALGAKAAAVPTSAVPKLRTARTLHHVRCTEEGLVIVSVAGEPEQTIAWGNVALLSVAEVDDIRQGSVDRIPGGAFRYVFRHAPEAFPDRTMLQEHGLEMLLMTVSPVRAYRVDADQMNYEYLGEQRSSSAEENFRRLVEDVRDRAANLILTPSAEAYLSGRLSGQSRSTTTSHRDAVAAHWVVEHLGGPGQPSPPSASSSPSGDSPPTSTSDDRLRQTHQKFCEKIDAVRASCGDPSEGPPQEMLISRLKELQTTMDQHFTAEEEPGYMQSVLDVVPGCNQFTSLLLQQHTSLRERLARLIGRSDDLIHDVRQFLESLEAHEHAENALRQSAEANDVASAD